MNFKIKKSELSSLNNKVEIITSDMKISPYGIHICKIGTTDISVKLPTSIDGGITTIVMYSTNGGDLILESDVSGAFDGQDTLTISNVGQTVKLAGDNGIYKVDDGINVPVPDAPIVSVDSPTTDKTPTFTYTNTGTNYRVRIDSDPWTDNGSNLTYTPSSDLTVATHNFYVQATDDDIHFGATGSAEVIVEAEVVPNNPVISVVTPTTNTTPQFTWTATGTYYQTNYNDLGWSASTTETSFDAPDLGVGTFGLRVRASNNDIDFSDGNNETFVEIEESKLVNTAQVHLNLLDNTDNTGVATEINATEYSIEYSDSAIFSGADSTVLTGTYTVQSDLLTVTGADTTELEVGRLVQNNTSIREVSEIVNATTFKVSREFPAELIGSFRLLNLESSNIQIPSLTLGNQFTLAFKMKMDDIYIQNNILGKYISTNNQFGVRTTGFGLQIYGDGGLQVHYQDMNPYANVDFSYIVIAWDGVSNNLKLFIENREIFNGTPSGTISFIDDASYDWVIGANIASNEDFGAYKLKELSMFNTALSDTDINTIYQEDYPTYSKTAKIADTIPSTVAQNLGFLSYYSGTLRFTNMFKESDHFRPSVEADVDFDENGYPTALRNGAYVNCYMVNSIQGKYPTGSYVVTYDGEGTIGLTGDPTNIVQETSNRITFDIPATSNDGITFFINTTDPNTNGNYIKNIKVFDVLNEPIIDTQVIHPIAKEQLSTETRYNLIRPMEAMNINASKVRTTDDIATLDFANWDSTVFNNAPYSCPYEAFISYANEMRCNVWFNIPCPIDVDVTGTITSTLGNQITLSGGNAISELKAGDRLRVLNTSSSELSFYVTVASNPIDNNIVPIVETIAQEYVSNYYLKICNDTFNELTEFIAEKVKDLLDPDLLCYFEFTNEHWNNSNAFAQHYQLKYEYDTEFPDEAGRPNNNTIMYSIYAKRMFNVITDVFNNKTVGTGTEEEYQNGSSRVIRVVGSQCSSVEQTTTALFYDDLYKYADAVAIAPYLQPSYFEDSNNFATIPSMTDAEIEPYFTTEADLRFGTNVISHKEICDVYGLRLISYEGGSHLPAYQYGGDQAVIDRMFDYNQSESMGNIYAYSLNLWDTNSSGELFTHYKDVDSLWGTYQDMFTKSQYRLGAIQDFIATKYPSSYLIDLDFTKANDQLINEGTGSDIYDATNVGSATFNTGTGLVLTGSENLTVPEVTSSGLAIELEVNTDTNVNNDVYYSNDIIIGGNRAGTGDPADMGIGINEGNKLSFFVNDQEQLSDTTIVGAGSQEVICSYDYPKRESRIYINGELESVNSRPSVATEVNLNPFTIGKAGTSGKYFTGTMKRFKLDNNAKPTTLKLMFIGSSVCRGTGATSERGHVYDKIQRLSTTAESVVNRCIGSTSTGTWISTHYDAVTADGLGYGNTYIGLSIGNEPGSDYSLYTTNYPTLIDKIRNGNNDVKIIAGSCYARSGQNAQYYIDVKDSVSFMETTTANYSVNLLGALDDGTGGIISALDADGAHPNDIGHPHMDSASSDYVLENIDIYDKSLIPNSMYNTTSYLYKPDALTPNAHLITTPDNLLHWSYKVELNCQDITQDKVLWSSNQGGLELKIFVDTDNAVKLTDGTTTVNTGINTTTMMSFHKFGISVHGYKGVDLYVDNSYVNTIDYSSAPVTISGVLNICVGGLYDPDGLVSSSDAIQVGFRNEVLWRSAQHTELMESTTLVKASQEFFSAGDDLFTNNESQTNTILTINDNNIVLN